MLAFYMVALQNGTNVNVGSLICLQQEETYMNMKAHIIGDTTADECVQKYGSRNWDAFKDFFGDTIIKYVKSDGYNAFSMITFK